MHHILRWLEKAATRRPALSVGLLAIVTMAMAVLATGLRVEVDLAQLGPHDSEIAQTMERVRNEFADPAATVQVIVDAGPDGDILTREGLDAIRQATQVAVGALGDALRADADGAPHILSLAPPLTAALDHQPAPDARGEDDPVGLLAVRVLAASPHLVGLVSDDFDPEAGTARASVSVAMLDPDLDDDERTDAAARVEEALADESEGALAGTDVVVASTGLFSSGLLDAIRAEIPRLFALALLVVLLVLALAYRSLFDVGVAFVGLVATVVWTFGIASLVGPTHLGWTGPLTQLAVIIPVLLVGLGIDYSVHLTARYREEAALGRAPRVAAGRALRTVGTALVLATAATAVGFASIATAPLDMLAEFGLFVAAGVVTAFLIMGSLVPAARVLRDRRAREDSPAAVRELGLERSMRGAVWVAQRAPGAGIVVAAVLVAASLLAASGLEVEFDRDDFVPRGSDVEAVTSHQRELFGGGVTESTFVLVDGDLTAPATANALWDAQQRVGQIDGVRTVAGRPQVLSVLSMVRAALDQGVPDPTERPSQSDHQPGPPAADIVSPESGFADESDLTWAYAALRKSLGDHRVNQLLTPTADAALVQIRTTTGDAGADRLQRELEALFAPVEDTGASVRVTSEPLIIAEMSQELAAFQAQAFALTLVVVLALLVGYYAVAHRRWGLGAIAMVPAVVSASLVLGTMQLLGMTFNVVTATMTAIAIGIGVPYGVHVVNRFVEHAGSSPNMAAAATLRGTGAPLAGAAVTTLGAFVVLAFSSLPPVQSLGLLGGSAIAYALLAALLVQPGALVRWAERRSGEVRGDGRGDRTGPDAPTTATSIVEEDA